VNAEITGARPLLETAEQRPVSDRTPEASDPLVKTTREVLQPLYVVRIRHVSPPPFPARAFSVSELCAIAGSSDEVGLIDHTPGVAAGDADEDALVQPVEIGRGGLDLG